MNTFDKQFSAAATAPVTPGSIALDQLVEAIAQGAEGRDRGTLPTTQAIDLIRQARLGAFRIPASQGGGGASLVELFTLIIRLGEADSNIPHILRNHFAFVEKALRTQHNPKFRRWLDETRRGLIFGLGASELNIQNIGNGDANTILSAEGEGYRLNGRKYYSTGNFYSDQLYVYASTPEGARVAAMLPTASEGVNVDDDWDGIGQRLTASGTTVFTDAWVEREDVVILAEEDVRQPFEATFPQLFLTALITGILRAVVRDATDLVRNRGRNFYHAVTERPGDDPLLQQVIGRLSALAYVAESAVLRAAEALARAQDSTVNGVADPDLRREASLRAAKSKVVLDELALAAASQLFDVGGASAARQSTRLDRHWRNIRTLTAHNPVSYKARAIGRYEIDGTPLPAGAFF